MRGDNSLTLDNGLSDFGADITDALLLLVMIVESKIRIHKGLEKRRPTCPRP